MIDTADMMTALVVGPDAYERMARGGREIRRLPTQDGSEGWVYPASVRQEAESLGFVFGEKLDDLFTEVTQAPAGWTFQSTDHPLYTSIVDDKGRIRGQMGSRTLYDTFANYHFLTRYAVDRVYEDGWFEKAYPPVLTKKVKQRVPAERGDRVESYSYDDYNGRVFWGGKQRPQAYTMKEVEVRLPDDQQPKPQGYWEARGIKDRETGEFIFVTDRMAVPARDSAEYMPWLTSKDEEEKRLWAVASEELARRFPDHADIRAYWS